MNIKQLIAAVLVLSATSAAFAQQAEVSNIQSGKTRAQVVAELQQAQQDGSAATYGFLGTNNPAAAAGNAAHTSSFNVIASGKTRSEVVADLKQSQASDSTTPTGVAYSVPAVNAASNTTNQAVAHK